MRTIACIVSLVALAACGSDATGPVNIVGTWTLASVDGKALPVTLLAGTATSCGVDVQSGQYILKDGGVYTGAESYGTLVNGTLFCAASYSEGGTYTEVAGVVTLKNLAGGGLSTLAVGRDALIRTLQGRQYVYRR